MRTRVIDGSADKQPSVINNATSNGGGDGGLGTNNIEEYLLDEARFRGGYNNSKSYYPSSLPGQMSKAAKLRTVSIIDTLSELARGGVELERERGPHVGTSSGTSPPFLPLNEFEKIPNLGDLDPLNRVNHRGLNRRRHVIATASSSTSNREVRERLLDFRDADEPTFQNLPKTTTTTGRKGGVNRDKRISDVSVTNMGGSRRSGSDKANELLMGRGLLIPASSLTVKHDKTKGGGSSSKSVVNVPTFSRYSASRVPAGLEVRVRGCSDKSQTNTGMGIAGFKGASSRHGGASISTCRAVDRDMSRSCFSDSEIDTDFLSSVRTNNNHSKTVSSRVTTATRSKCSSDDCLDWDDGTPWDTRPRSRVKPANTRGHRDDHRLSASIIEETKTSPPCPVGVEAFNPAKPISQRYPKKHRMPEWIRTLFKTAKQGNLEMLKHGMVDMDSALVRNLSDHSGNSLWHLCAAHNHLACVQWLCAKFGSEGLEDENKSGQRPVILAVKFGSLSVVQWLMERQSQTSSVPDGANRTLLHCAAKYGQSPVLNWLLNYSNAPDGVDVNHRDINGNTPLHLAAKYGHIQCAKELVLQSGDITLRNEAGLKPYDVAIRNNFKACAEYLLSIEATISLATEQCILESEIYRYRIENSDGRKLFKDLLHLVKCSLRHQREMLESFKKIQEEFQQKEEEADDHSAESEKGEDRRNDNIHTEFQNILSQEINRFCNAVLPKDTNACHTIEEKWKRVCRKTSQHVTASRRDPLEIVRSQFSRVQARASCYVSLQDVEVASSSESSLSGDSGDETEGIFESRPNVDLSDHGSFASRLKGDSPRGKATGSRTSEGLPSLPTSSSEVKKKRVTSVVGGVSRLQASAVENRPWSYHAQLPHSDVDLRVLFDRNPELKQEGRTCSVLEVLEPSSSENEELTQIEKHYGGGGGGNHAKSNSKGLVVSESRESSNPSGASSSSTKTVRSPLRIKVPPTVVTTKSNQEPSSTTDSKNGASGGFSNNKDGSANTDFSRRSLPQKPSSHQAITITLTAGGTSRELVTLPDGQRKIQVSSTTQNRAALPSKSTSKTSKVLPPEPRDVSTTDEAHSEPESTSLVAHSTQILDTTGSESCTSSSSPENSDSTGRGDTVSTSGTQPGTVLKKKGFLLKFSLKNRWSSKQKLRVSKKSSESSGGEDSLKDSSAVLTSATTTNHHQDGPSYSPAEAQSFSSQDSSSLNESAPLPAISNSHPVSEDISETHSGTMTNEPTQSQPEIVSTSNQDGGQHLKKMERFLPPPPPPPTVRREPPPMPPVDENDPDYERPMEVSPPSSAVLPDILSASNLITSAKPSSSSSSENKEETEDTLSNKERYCSASEISRLYCSTGKLDSRPPSSASRIDSSLRSDDTYKSISFPLSKMSSASTELLVTPDSSTAGRQSPAPSEVSKTESALSPPSDVSKTESHRHTNHLGRIDEILSVKKSENDNTPTTILDISQVSHCQDSNQDSEEMKEYETIPESTTSDEFRQSTSTNKKRLNRPWYEVSDDEDILTPGRFKPLGAQSNSEDEDNTILR